MIGSSGNKLPSSESHLFSLDSAMVEMGSSYPCYSENSKGFRSFKPEIGVEMKYVFSYVTVSLLFLTEVYSFSSFF